MNKRFLLIMFLILCTMQFLIPVSYAESATVTYDFLYERGNARGNSAPTKETNLPYTANWNSVRSYTNTNYYFSGYTAVKVVLFARMNYSGESGRFKVYFVDKTAGTSTCIIDSDTAKFSYSCTRYIFPESSHSWYLKFTISGNDTSCFGSMDITVA